MHLNNTIKALQTKANGKLVEFLQIPVADGNFEF